MLRSILVLITALALAAKAPSQVSLAQIASAGITPVSIEVSAAGDGVLVVDTNRNTHLIRVVNGGELSISTHKGQRDYVSRVASMLDLELFPQGPIVNGEGPTLQTKYVDKKGNEHVIVTPVVGTTPNAMRSAIETHQELVAAMHKLYPPKNP